MAEIGPVLIPAIAAVGGAGIAAVGAYVSNRERYSQRIERLAKVREGVADNRLLVTRLDGMIHHELSNAASLKQTTGTLYMSMFFLAMGYSHTFLYGLSRVREGEQPPPLAKVADNYIFSIVLIAVGAYLYLQAIRRRRKITEQTLPAIFSEDEIASYYRYRYLKQTGQLEDPEPPPAREE